MVSFSHSVGRYTDWVGCALLEILCFHRILGKKYNGKGSQWIYTIHTFTILSEIVSNWRNLCLLLENPIL